jgi:hypothetical protein
MVKATEKDLLDLLNNIEMKNFSFIEYLNNKSKSYPKMICIGKENIPTPQMFENMISINQALLDLHPQIKLGFERLKQIASDFYLSLVKVMERAKSENLSFESEFDNLVQPFGQNFVNNLKALKYKIDGLRIDNVAFFLKSCLKKPIEIKIKTTKFKLFRKVVLRMKKTLVFYPQTSYKAYILMTIFGVIASGTVAFNLAGSVDAIERASFTASYASIAVLILFMASFAIQLFEYTDISGKNVLAYNYKTMLNSMLYQANH